MDVPSIFNLLELAYRYVRMNSPALRDFLDMKTCAFVKHPLKDLIVF